MLPHLSPDDAKALREALTRARYTTDGVRGLLGGAAHAALGRGEPEPAFRAVEAAETAAATTDADALGVLVRLLLLGSREPDAAVAAAFAPLAPADAAAAGLLVPDGAGWRAALDLRPYGVADGPDWWVLSDLDARRQERDHVTGVGAASVTLAAATVRRPVGSVLDLGTGCGVQALHASRHAQRVTGTDVAPRALALAAATFALNDVDVELVDGPWLAPVAGRRFDQIVSNPPFVPGPARVEFVYRDSGADGDAALGALVADLAAHLAPGGVAQVLASWLHVRGEDWPDRVRSWLPAGCDAWVVQREVADPALHVGTWQRDGGLDPAAPAGRTQARAWLEWMDRAAVEAIGFGLLTLRRTDDEPTVVFEDLREPFDDPLGPEVEGWLDRVDWLRAHLDDAALLSARLRLAPSVLLERRSEPGPEGWATVGAAVARQDGPRWRHEVDGPAADLLAGCHGALPLGELVELLAMAHDRPTDALVAATLPAVREFVRHGLLTPSTDAG